MHPSRSTLLLAATALLLGAYALTCDRETDAARSDRSAAREAFLFAPAEVASLTLSRGGTDAAPAIVLDRTPSGWNIEAPIRARADAEAVDRLLQTLHGLPLANLVIPPRPDDPEAYAPYGLAPPRATVTLSLPHPAPPRTFLVGNRTPLGDGVYLRALPHPAVLRVPDSLPDLLPASVDALRDRVLVRADPAAIDRLDLRGPAGYIQLVRDLDGSWRLHQPFASRADSAAVAALLDAVLSCSIVQFVQDNARDLAPYGLDSQSAITVVLSVTDGSGPRVLALGDPLPNDPTLVYARLQSEHSVYAVPAALRLALLARPDDLRDRRVPGLSPLADPAAVAAIRFDAPSGTLALARAPDVSWTLAAPFAAPADPDAAADLLRSLSELRVAAFPDPSAVLPSDYPVTLSVTLADRPDAPLVYRAAPVPDDTPAPPDAAWLLPPNTPTPVFASPADTLLAPVSPAPYLSKTLLAIPPEDIAALLLAPPPSAGLPEIRFDHAPDGSWTPDTPALRDALAALSPLHTLSFLPADASLPADDDAFTLTLLLRGATGISRTLRFAASPDAPATLLSSPHPFLLPLSTHTALLALLPAP